MNVSDVTVVVPVHGDPAILLPLLRELDGQSRAARAQLRVLISDDGSREPVSSKLAVDDFDSLDLTVVRSEVNRGPGGARNAALPSVETPWVAFLDADVVPMRGWLARLVTLISDPGAPDAIEGQLVIPSQSRPTPFMHATDAEPPAQRVAANEAFRVDVLRGVGGFDERFYDVARRLHFREDAELAFRLEVAGARFGYDRDLRVEHPPLPASFWVPMRLARRYHFDPLLARLHPTRFRAMNELRKVGPISLRRARHLAASAFVGFFVLMILAALLRLPTVAVAAAVLVLVSWGMNVVALCWRRRLHLRDLVPVVAAAAIVPWVYLWHHWRGVIKFRHLPRM